MSLYNTLFGINEETPVLLGMINVNKGYFARFRDVDLIANGTIIRVMTRTGGVNREQYKENWETIRKNKLYIRDYDDNYDETYAYTEFYIPDNFKETAKKMFKGEPMTFKEKFERELKEMAIEGTEAYARAEAIAQKIIKSLDDKGDIKIISL